MTKPFGKYLSVLAAMVAVLSSCKKDMPDNSPKGPLELSHATILVGRDPITIHIGVTAREAAWEITGVEPWFEVSPAAGEPGVARVEVVFSANDAEGAETRTATLTVSSAGVQKTIEVEQLPTDISLPNEDPDMNLNKDIQELLDKWYYNGETLETPGDPNQSYATFYQRYLSKGLVLNKLDGNDWSSTGNDPEADPRYLYSYIERYPAGTLRPDFVPLNYGMEFELVNGMRYNGSDPVARVLYVTPDSPAEKAGLRRGSWFWKVNDVKMGSWKENQSGLLQYNRLIDSLVNPVAGESPKLGMLSFRSWSSMLYDENRTATVTPDEFHGNPILYSNSTDTGTSGQPNHLIIRHRNNNGYESRTGYMVYNSFDPGFEQELIDEFARFKTHDLTHFILDLRYNKTGTVEMAELMGNLLVPEEARGKVFANYKFSDSASAYSGQAVFEPHENSIGIDTLFILTSRHTAGGSELLINGINGIPDVMKLVVVGETTEGMSVGLVKQILTDEAGYEYDIRIAAFRCSNGKDVGDYEYGFSPNVKVDEWDNVQWSETWGWKGGTQSIEDPMLEETMEHIFGRKAMPIDDVNKAAMRKRAGYFRQFSVPTTMMMEKVPVN